MLIPAMRAIPTSLPLALLVPGVLADHEHPAVAADDLALFTHRLHRRSYLHNPFRLMIQTGGLWRPGRPPLPCPRSGSHAEASRLRARQSRLAKARVPPGRLLRPCTHRDFAAGIIARMLAQAAVSLAALNPIVAHDSKESYPLSSVGHGAPAAYGRAVPVRAGGTWLQYWLFYDYQDQDRGIV